MGCPLVIVRRRASRQITPRAWRLPVARRLTHPVVVGPLIFLTILAGYLLSFNVDKPTHNADWFIRYQVSCAIVEHNQFYFDPYRGDGRTGPGADGHIYSQYTLGQSTAMIPFYLLGRELAGMPQTNCDAKIAPPIVFLTAKALDLVLGALLCTLFFATARLLGYARRVSLALTFLLAFGSSLWPDVLSSEEHTMESLFLLAASYAALRYTPQRRKNRVWVFIMGLAAGLVFVTRVAGVIAAPIFAIYLVLLHMRGRRGSKTPGAWKRSLLRDELIFAAGVIPSIVVNGLFNALRFGKPWRFGPGNDESFGFPMWQGLLNLLLSPGKGLLWYSPVVLLLILAARPFWRRFPLPARLFTLTCGVYLLFYANVNYWHGDPAWGPRYLYATLPYLILPLGEVWRRWRGYARPVRAVLIGVLACSFLVQFSAVSVSYWRHWHYIYGYHYDQVEDHAWGQNLHYFWLPEQSPILLSLEGIADITQKYVDGAPLLQHSEAQRLSNPDESSSFKVYGQTSIYLTDLDDLNLGANWNTFTMWWAHTFSWWDQATETRIALSLLGVFLAGNGALLALLRQDGSPARSRGRRFTMAMSPAISAAGGPTLPFALGNAHGNGNGRSAGHGYNGAGTGNGHDGHGYSGAPGAASDANGHGSGHGNGRGIPADIAALPELEIARQASASGALVGGQSTQAGQTEPLGGGGSIVGGTSGTTMVEAPVEAPVAVRRRTGRIRRGAGVGPVAGALFLGALIYGGIMNVAALTAPRQAPPLVHTYPAGASVRDGAWEYRVLDYTIVKTLPLDIEPPTDIAHHYIILRLQVTNHTVRPWHMRADAFHLTNPQGLECLAFIQWKKVQDLAQLYHLTPLGTIIPPRSTVDGAMIFLVRDSAAQPLELLGPGIALVPLDTPAAITRQRLASR